MEATLFELTVVAQDSMNLRHDIERVFRNVGATFELWVSAPDKLLYEVIVGEDVEGLSHLIRNLHGPEGASIWRAMRSGLRQGHYQARE